MQRLSNHRLTGFRAVCFKWGFFFVRRTGPKKKVWDGDSQFGLFYLSTSAAFGSLIACGWVGVCSFLWPQNYTHCLVALTATVVEHRTHPRYLGTAQQCSLPYLPPFSVESLKALGRVERFRYTGLCKIICLVFLVGHSTVAAPR